MHAWHGNMPCCMCCMLPCLCLPQHGMILVSLLCLAQAQFVPLLLCPPHLPAPCLPASLPLPFSLGTAGGMPVTPSGLLGSAAASQTVALLIALPLPYTFFLNRHEQILHTQHDLDMYRCNLAWAAASHAGILSSLHDWSVGGMPCLEAGRQAGAMTLPWRRRLCLACLPCLPDSSVRGRQGQGIIQQQHYLPLLGWTGPFYTM